MSNDISLTDFIYAVVAGAAFQKIGIPLLTYKNYLLLFVFILLLDDWYYFHTIISPHQKKGSQSIKKAIEIAFNICILLIWYAFAVTANIGYSKILSFLFLFALFYFLILIWELIFIQKIFKPRLVMDLLCVFLGVVLMIILYKWPHFFYEYQEVFMILFSIIVSIPRFILWFFIPSFLRSV